MNLESIFNKIPIHEVVLEDVRLKKQKKSDIPELKFCSITSKTKLDKFIILDTETTGLSLRDELIEISAIKFINFQPTELFTTLLKPKKPIPEQIARINSITNDMIAEAPTFSNIATSLYDFIDGWNLVGHNLIFHLQFLHVNGFDLSPKRKYYDTLALAQKTLKLPKQKWDKELEEYCFDYDRDFDVFDYKLSTLCECYSIPSFHRSAPDCLSDMYLLRYLLCDKYSIPLNGLEL